MKSVALNGFEPETPASSAGVSPHADAEDAASVPHLTPAPQHPQPAWQTEGVAPGGQPSVYDFAFATRAGARSVKTFVYAPAPLTPDMPVVIVMHGVSRNGWSYLRSWMGLADANRFVLLIPEFAQASWPTSREYNRGNVRDGDGNDLPATEWGFTAVETIFDAVRDHCGLTTDKYRIYGHSAGAQFVHRLVLHTGGERIVAAVAANAGWYMVPDWHVGYPYGLSGSSMDADVLRAAFGTPLTILLGARDDAPGSRNLRLGRRAMKQGQHRLARGLHFISAAERAARSADCGLRWTAQIVQDAGHSNRAMAPSACAALFDAQR